MKKNVHSYFTLSTNNNLPISSQYQVSELSTSASVPDYQVPSTSQENPALSVQQASSDTESKGG